MIEIAWHAPTIAATIEAYEAALPSHGWPNWVLGNHDKPRLATRVGEQQARVAAMLLLTLRGTPTLYYGDEIGMTNVPIPPERIRDPWEKNVPGFGVGRDPVRTPMQWNDTAQAGFSTGTPWLPVAPEALTVNVAAQRADPSSLLYFYRRLIHMRRAELALTLGAYKPSRTTDAVMLYTRELGTKHVLIALNFTHQPQTIMLTTTKKAGTILLSTHLDRENEAFKKQLQLRPDEGLIAHLVR